MAFKPNMAAKLYDVTIPRVYKDRSTGQDKTHFWQVGTGFALREREGISVKLYSKMLLTDQFVIFARDEEEPAGATPPPPDDIPF